MRRLIIGIAAAIVLPIWLAMRGAVNLALAIEHKWKERRRGAR
jgi:hypothetical protein